MPRLRFSCAAAHGYTLPELLLTLALSAVLLALAGPSWRQWQERHQAEAVRDRLLMDLQFARVLALQRGQSLQLSARGDCAWRSSAATDWSCGWQLRDEAAAVLLDTALDAPLQVSYTKSTALTVSARGDLGQIGDRWTVQSRQSAYAIAQSVCLSSGGRLRWVAAATCAWRAITSMCTITALHAVASMRVVVPRPSHLRAQREDGFALLEAAAALMLLAVGLLALLWLQQQHLTQQRQQLAHEAAHELAQDLAERLRLNPAQASLYAQTWGMPATSVSGDCTAQACSPVQRATWDVSSWRQQVQALLPQGDAAVFAATAGSGWWGVVLAWHDDGESLRTDTDGGSPVCPVQRSCWRLWVHL